MSCRMRDVCRHADQRRPSLFVPKLHKTPAGHDETTAVTFIFSSSSSAQIHKYLPWLPTPQQASLTFTISPPQATIPPSISLIFNSRRISPLRTNPLHIPHNTSTPSTRLQEVRCPPITSTIVVLVLALALVNQWSTPRAAAATTAVALPRPRETTRTRTAADTGGPAA